MDFKRREEIFAKEYISTKELAELFDLDPSTASTRMNNIKRKVGDRLGIKGKLHIEDYFEYFNIQDRGRYTEAMTLSVNAPRGESGRRCG